MVEMLWTITENKHEADLRVIYELIPELARSLELDSLDLLFKHINSIPAEDHNEVTITLLRDFSIKSMENLASE